MRSLLAGMLLLVLAAGCTSGDTTLTTPVPEDTTPVVTATSIPTPTPPPLERLSPLDEPIVAETAPTGLIIWTADVGAAARLTGDDVPRPIRFDGDALISRVGDDVVRLNGAGETTELIPAIAVTPGTHPQAPGLRDEDFDLSPDLRYRIERVTRPPAPGQFVSPNLYDLVLVDLETGDRTTVIRDQARCQCDRFPLGAWSGDGRYIDLGSDRTVLVDPEAIEASIVPGAPNAFWSIRDELIVVSEHGVSIDHALLLDRPGDVIHSADGVFLGVSFGSRLDDDTGFTIYKRRGLEPVLVLSGRIDELASDGTNLVATLRDFEGCAFGITLVGTAGGGCRAVSGREQARPALPEGRSRRPVRRAHGRGPN